METNPDIQPTETDKTSTSEISFEVHHSSSPPEPILESKDDKLEEDEFDIDERNEIQMETEEFEEEEELGEDNEEDYFLEPSPPREPLNKKKEWKEFLKFVGRKKNSKEKPLVSMRYARNLKRIEDNMEIVRRIANVKYKPRDQLTMDDYLAWYAVEEGKVIIPGPLMDLIRPEHVRISPSTNQSSGIHLQGTRRRSGIRGPLGPEFGIPEVPSQPEILPIGQSKKELRLELSPTGIRQPTPGIFSLGRLF